MAESTWEARKRRIRALMSDVQGVREDKQTLAIDVTAALNGALQYFVGQTNSTIVRQQVAAMLAESLKQIQPEPKFVVQVYPEDTSNILITALDKVTEQLFMSALAQSRAPRQDVD